MLRCPFNGFSKCDGSCPFSMPDFCGCKLATALVAIGGQTQGAHERLVSISEQLDGITKALEVGSKPDATCVGLTHFSGTYLICRMRSSNHSEQPEVRLSLSDEDAGSIIAELGETVNYVFNDSDASILLMRGSMRKLSKPPVNSGRRVVSMQSDGARIVSALGEFRRVGYDVVKYDGLFKLTPDGRRD